MKRPITVISQSCNGCTTKAIDYAAWNGHLEIVQWLKNIAQ
jgi:hypothetical protein